MSLFFFHSIHRLMIDNRLFSAVVVSNVYKHKVNRIESKVNRILKIFRSLSPSLNWLKKQQQQLSILSSSIKYRTIETLEFFVCMWFRRFIWAQYILKRRKRERKNLTSHTHNFISQITKSQFKFSILCYVFFCFFYISTR